eukprot:NODE_217_length_14216_cov_0.430545.p3 type:complete len:489 gc:universal NODE_217_length_14216_cov_0.430545:5887-4421(-)
MPSLPISDVFSDLPDLDNLCFEYGVEYEGDKIDIPANRYDLLTEKSLYHGLQQYRDPKPVKYIKLDKPSNITVAVDDNSFRPYVVCAVVKGLNLNDENYQALLDLQEKLHFNVCRRRTLVAIGVHDLEKVGNKVYYSCKKPTDIKFVPLNQSTTLHGDQVEEYYKNDKHFSKYVPLLTKNETFPLIYDDSKVLSLPPVVNSDFTKVVPNKTKDIFIECTATDLFRAHTTLNVLVFACKFWSFDSFSIESVAINYKSKSTITPDLTSRELHLSIDEINSFLSLELTPREVLPLLLKMDVLATVSNDNVIVHVPPQRTDILHKVDVIEDVGIGYSFNKLPRREDFSMTVAKPQHINSTSDKIRREMAQLGYTESLGLTLVSFAEANEFMRLAYSSNITNFTKLSNNPEFQLDDKVPVILENPSSVEFQQMRTMLIPGLIKFIAENLHHKLPMQVFEVGDVIYQHDGPKKARNQRNLAAIYAGKQSGFEVI